MILGSPFPGYKGLWDLGQPCGWFKAGSAGRAEGLQWSWRQKRWEMCTSGSMFCQWPGGGARSHFMSQTTGACWVPAHGFRHGVISGNSILQPSHSDLCILHWCERLSTMKRCLGSFALGTIWMSTSRLGGETRRAHVPVLEHVDISEYPTVIRINDMGTYGPRSLQRTENLGWWPGGLW